MWSASLLFFAVTAALIAAGCESAVEHAPALPGPSDLERVAPALIPLAARHDAASSPVAFDSFRGGVWTANHDVGTLSYVDVDARRVVAEIPIGHDVRSVALSPDGKWIAAVDRQDGTVSLVDAEALVVRRTIPLGGHPRAVVWDTANPRYFYVAVEDDDEVVLIDRVTPEVIAHIAVGRLPAGLAASRQNREIYVSHRIDASVSVVDLRTRSLAADIALGDEPPDADAKRAQGRPFAFESLAWTPDGMRLWAPHQLLAATTRPFQFQRVIFPAVSVVDVGARAEVKTDPVDPNGAIAGRKVLFGALNVIDGAGETTIFSQPCAAVLHPNGVTGYAIACGSEDLLVFDAHQGILVDMVRNLPGDHPVGLALDDVGARAWVLAEQSHTLTMLDLANGNPVKRVRIVGDPMLLVARDPAPPDVREGQKLFFRASSSKGSFATTGNNWMACASCHLDGFGRTNSFLLTTLASKDEARDAQLGHIGLKDLFSTAATPDDAAFDPHDMVVALLDQGGLAPDRSGKSRAGEVDPKAPPPDVRTMAKQLSRVFARDLPFGPSWTKLRGQAPDPSYDGAWCGNCHQAEYQAWRQSAHAHASEDPMVRFGITVEQRSRGPQYARLCVGCHDPVSARLGDVSLTASRGITCRGCHDVDRLVRAGGNADLEATTHDFTQDHREWARASLVKLRSPELCGGCHEQFVPGTGLHAIGTLTEHRSAPSATCVDCHMPGTSAGVTDHRFPGGNVFLAKLFGHTTLAEDETSKLRSALGVAAIRTKDGARVTVTNIGAGHAFPTGVTDIREPWVEVQAVRADGSVVARFGGPSADGLLGPGVIRFGMDIAKADGTLLLLHELSDSTRIPFDGHIPARGTGGGDIAIPGGLPAGATRLEAVLFYRNVRTPYYRAASGDGAGTTPAIEIARAVVP